MSKLLSVKEYKDSVRIELVAREISFLGKTQVIPSTLWVEGKLADLTIPAVGEDIPVEEFFTLESIKGYLRWVPKA
jgi:hypothetical protein